MKLHKGGVTKSQFIHMECYHPLLGNTYNQEDNHNRKYVHMPAATHPLDKSITINASHLATSTAIFYLFCLWARNSGNNFVEGIGIWGVRLLAPPLNQKKTPPPRCSYRFYIFDPKKRARLWGTYHTCISCVQSQKLYRHHTSLAVTKITYVGPKNTLCTSSWNQASNWQLPFDSQNLSGRGPTISNPSPTHERTNSNCDHTLIRQMATLCWLHTPTPECTPVTLQPPLLGPDSPCRHSLSPVIAHHIPWAYLLYRSLLTPTCRGMLSSLAGFFLRVFSWFPPAS